MGAGASTGGVVYHCHRCTCTFKPPPVSEDFPEVPVLTCIECGSEFLECGVDQGRIPEDALQTLRACALGGDALSPEELLMNLSMLRPNSEDGLQQSVGSSGRVAEYNEEESLEDRILAQAATLSMEEAERTEHPTPLEVRNEVPKTKVDKSFRWSRVPGGSKECAVCFSDMVIGSSVRTLPCNHVFHNNCIIPWLKTQAVCPICRHSLVPQ
mmetsp:Transcript_8322/g.11241  ORF Transcript_8322/g.11241 Transcript_8322/m.11241 type:complete len:212 (-) Transcript_8322:341-976(-)